MGLDGQTLPYAEGDETDCRIRLWQLGSYLVALHNNGCGGLTSPPPPFVSAKKQLRDDSRSRIAVARRTKASSKD